MHNSLFSGDFIQSGSGVSTDLEEKSLSHHQ